MYCYSMFHRCQGSYRLHACLLGNKNTRIKSATAIIVQLLNNTNITHYLAIKTGKNNSLRSNTSTSFEDCITLLITSDSCCSLS